MVIISEYSDLRCDDSQVKVQLGFAVPGHDSDFAHNFASKVGGKPAWMRRDRVLCADQTRCNVCGEQMYLLLQMYTPNDDSESDAFHRMVYLFICRKLECHREAGKNHMARAIRVYREQMSERESLAQADRQAVSRCIVCNLLGELACTGCGAASYCSLEHQQIHWNNHGHSKACGSSSAGVKFGFEPELLLVSEDEPDAGVGRENMLLELRKTLEAMKLVIPSDSKQLKTVPKSEREIEEGYEKTLVDVDKAFLLFQKRVIRDNEQVLRYARVYTDEDYFPSEDKEPLWVRDDQRPSLQQIGCCSNCRQPRTFEFQVMPQILNHLQLDHLDSNTLDFGVIAIYTCPNDCNISENFLEEGFFVQNPTLDGINQHFQRLAKGATCKDNLDSESESDS